MGLCDDDSLIEQYSDASLNTVYRLFNEGKIEIDAWFSNIQKVLLTLYKSPSQPIVLSIDETMTEKFGKYFEDVSIIFNHACHGGSCYLNGHCFVSLLASVPIVDGNNRHYLRSNRLSYADKRKKHTFNGCQSCFKGNGNYWVRASGDSLL